MITSISRTPRNKFRTQKAISELRNAKALEVDGLKKLQMASLRRKLALDKGVAAVLAAFVYGEGDD